MINDDLIELFFRLLAKTRARPDTAFINVDGGKFSHKMDEKISPWTSRAYIDSDPVFVYILIWPTSGHFTRVANSKTGRFVGALSIINDVVTSVCFSIDRAFMAANISFSCIRLDFDKNQRDD